MTALVLAAALLVPGCAATTSGSPTTGDGVPDEPAGTGSAALEFRVVLQAVPAVDPTAPPVDPATAKTARQSTDVAVQREQLDALDCAAADPLRGATVPAQPLVTCALDASEKFVLGPTEFTGTDVAEATAGRDQFGAGHVVTIRFTGAGAARWTELTAANVGQRIAFTIDGAVVSAPSVNEAITGDTTTISGAFTEDDAERLADQIMRR